MRSAAAEPCPVQLQVPKMTYAALKAEIALPAYEGLSDAEIVAALNAETIDAWRDLSTGEVAGFALLNLAWTGIKALAANAEAPSEARAVADAALTLLTNPAIQTVQLSDETKRTTFIAMLDALVSAGAITSDHKAGLLAMAQSKTSRAALLGMAGLTVGDLESARAA